MSFYAEKFQKKGFSLKNYVIRVLTFIFCFLNLAYGKSKTHNSIKFFPYVHPTYSTYAIYFYPLANEDYCSLIFSQEIN